MSTGGCSTATWPIVVGPVFPHEVVGFSGGNKYFFPGVSGPELIDASHWLGALITASRSSAREARRRCDALIDRAAALIPVERLCIAMVVRTEDAALHGLYLGTCEDAWAAASAQSADVHIATMERPYATSSRCVPPMYADLWTAGKGVYKLEPVVADGGELIVYAPHIQTFSVTHGTKIARAGYHCRDYFLAEPERFAGVPRGVLAHGTHVRGSGVRRRDGSRALPDHGLSRERHLARGVRAGRARLADPARSIPPRGRSATTCSSFLAQARSCIGCRTEAADLAPTGSVGIVRFR